MPAVRGWVLKWLMLIFTCHYYPATRTNGSCVGAVEISDLDTTLETLRKVSPAVDDLTCCLYPPMEHATVKQNVRFFYVIHLYATFIRLICSSIFALVISKYSKCFFTGGGTCKLTA